MAAEFTIPLQDKTVTEHQEVTLNCSLSKPNKEIEWKKDSTLLTNDDDNYKITSDGCEHTLTIKDATIDLNETEFTAVCGEKSTSANLFVEELPAGFKSPLSPQTCIEEETITLTCETDKNVPVKWFKNGTEITEGLRYKITRDGNVCSLTIKEAKLSDKHNYKCVITKSGNSCSAPLIVKGNFYLFLLNFTLFSYLNFLFVEKPTEITVPLRDQISFEEDSVTFTCELNKPNKKVSWFKDDTELNISSDEYTISNDEFSYSLTVQKCCLNDGGTYTMTCEEAETSANLMVQGNLYYLFI